MQNFKSRTKCQNAQFGAKGIIHKALPNFKSKLRPGLLTIAFVANSYPGFTFALPVPNPGCQGLPF
jgi:hypothetical protein